MRPQTGSRALLLAALLWGPAHTGVAAQQAGGVEAEVFAEALRAIGSLHRTVATDSALWTAALAGMIESLDDPYASIMNPVESDAFVEETTGNYSGIGVQITALNEVTTVTAVFRGTPAEQGGVQVGDVIVGVNGHDASGWANNMVSDSIRGPVGTMVDVRFARAGYDQPLSFSMRRDQVHVPAVSHGVLDGNIGYVIVDRMARSAAQEMDDALKALADTRGLIVDLRGNPGGLLDEALMLADVFLARGTVLAVTAQREPDARESDTSREVFYDRFPIRVPDLPMVVLVDGYSASGAEILAGALQDHDRALILGERTFGKGLVQTVLALPHNRRLSLTTGVWRTPLGCSLHRERDARMRPLGEDLDTLPRVTTPEGRTLIDGGGVIPDLEVAADTLTLAERTLIRTVGELRLPLGVRLAEFTFQEAARLRAAAAEPSLDEESFQGFVQALVADGLPGAMADDEGTQAYLRWRARMGIAQRMDDPGREADFRMERDPVLAEAVRLLGSASSQMALFGEVAERSPHGARGGSSYVGPQGRTHLP